MTPVQLACILGFITGAAAASLLWTASYLGQRRRTAYRGRHTR